ncbi:MAG: MBL fold metallo-hydrolase [Mycobacteriales bacterium]
MKLTVLGCSGSMPGPAGPASSYLVEHDGFRLLLDLGSGAFGALQRHADPAQVDAVVLSHLHPDHFIDLCPYVVYRLHGPAGRLPAIPVLGPPGTHDRLSLAHDPHNRHGLRGVFSFGAVTPGERELGPFRLRFERVDHPVETHAVRVEAGGRSLTYSGDTAPSAALVGLAAGSDVLLCEASWADDGSPHPPNLHLSGREAGEHATKAGVGRLLVTHLQPWSDRDRIGTEAAAAFTASELVRPDASYQI